MNWVQYVFGHELLHWIVIALLAAGGIAVIVEIPNRLGMALGGSLLAIAAGYTAYDAGFRAAHNAEEIAVLKAQIAQQAAIVQERDREAKVAAQMAVRQSERLGETEDLAKRLQGKVDDYVAKLAADDPCVATDADVGGMQRIDAEADKAKPAPRARNAR